MFRALRNSPVNVSYCSDWFAVFVFKWSLENSSQAHGPVEQIYSTSRHLRQEAYFK